MQNIENDVLKVLVSKEQIDARCAELAKQIEQDYDGKNPLFLVLLNGALPFMAKLCDYIKIPMEYDCIRVHSYVGKTSTGNIIVENYHFDKLKNRHVVLVEDIIDSGLTLHTLTDLLDSKGTASIEICALLNKPVLNQIELNPKYVGFNVPNEFVIGFGLDYDQQYRNLPYVGVLKPEAIKK